MNCILKKLFKYFAEGLLIVVPFTCTVFLIIYGLYRFHQGITFAIKYIPILSQISVLPGSNILTVFLGIAAIGYLSSHFFVRNSIDYIEEKVSNTPILGIVYTYFKESASGILGKFDRPVLVTINKALNTEKVGFLTQESLKNLNVQDKVAVYVPYAYSFAGETLIVSSQYVKVLEGVSSTDLFRFALTGGLSGIKRPLTLGK